MLNALRPALDRLLGPVTGALARTPITPNALTIIGTVGVSAGALTLYPTGHLFARTMVCWFFVIADMLDGALARVKGTTGSFGAFLDSTLDRVADASVFAGLAAWFVLGGHSKLMAGVTLFCLVTGALVSYAKARAESLGLRADVGLAERTERLLIALVAAGLFGLGVPYVLPAGLWVLAAASAFTAAQRLLAADRAAAVGSWARLGLGAGPGSRCARRWIMPGLKDRLTAAGYGLGWSVVCRVPESWAWWAFRVTADIAWRRQGPQVQVLEANLRRVLDPDATGAELRALSRESMRSYARYWLEVFRLPVTPPERLNAQTAASGHVQDALDWLAGGPRGTSARSHLRRCYVVGAWGMRR